MYGVKGFNIIYYYIKLLLFFSLTLSLYNDVANAFNYQLETIVDSSTAIPEGSGNFTGFEENHINLGSSEIAFTGFGSSLFRGIYTTLEGSINKIIDNNASIPEGAGNFTGMVLASYLGNLNFAFIGSGSSDQTGIYKIINESAVKVADTNTLIPNDTVTFDFFSRVVNIGNNKVAFSGQIIGIAKGAYLEGTSGLIVVMDANTAIPEGTGNFVSFGSPKSSGNGEVVMQGGDNVLQNGIYIFQNGLLSKIADRNTQTSDGFIFESFVEYISLGGNKALFRAFQQNTIVSKEGIYKYDNGQINSIIDDANDTVPGTTTKFEGFILLPLNSSVPNNFIFMGRGVGVGTWNIYKYVNGVISLVADINTPIPEGSGNFTSFREVISLGGVDVAFHGIGSSGQEGLYAQIGGELIKVANLNTPIPDGNGNFTAFGLDGSIIIPFRPISLGGGDIAFRGFGSSDQVGIYRSFLNIEDAILKFINDIDYLVESGLLTSGRGNMLIKNLESITNVLDNDNSLCRKYNNFLKKIDSVITRENLGGKYANQLNESGVLLNQKLGCL